MYHILVVQIRATTLMEVMVNIKKRKMLIYLCNTFGHRWIKGSMNCYYLLCFPL